MTWILTKRSAPSDDGHLSHHVYGVTQFVGEARSWYRASRVTDVIEVPSEKLAPVTGPDGNGYESIIRDTRFISWREQQLTNDKLIAATLKKENP